MQFLTPEKIADLCKDLDGIKNRAAINKLYREQDESHLFPINGKFNATERAIRNVRRFMRDGGYDLQGYDYSLTIDRELSNIVNSEV